MRTHGFLLLLSLALLISCSLNYNRTGVVLKKDIVLHVKESNKIDNSAFLKVHSLKRKDGKFIGDIYVKFINDTIFTELYIVNKTDTLYSIKKSILVNTKGKDIEVFSDGFYGYKFVLKKNEYIVLSYYRNKGANVSDDITIEWNYDRNLLEVQKAP